MLPEKEENRIIYKAPSPGGPVEKGASGITIYDLPFLACLDLKESILKKDSRDGRVFCSLSTPLIIRLRIRLR